MSFSANCALALVALFFVQGLCAAHVRRSADAANPLQELVDNAKTQLRTVTEELNKILESSNVDEIKTVLESKTKELEARAKSIIDELKRQYETHGPELSEKVSSAITEATNHINASMEQLKAQLPGMASEAATMHQRIADSFKSTAEIMFEETGKIAKAAGDEASDIHTTLTNLSRDALTQTMEVMTQLHNEVQEAVKRATA